MNVLINETPSKIFHPAIYDYDLIVQSCYCEFSA